MLTVRQTAEALGVSTATVYGLIAARQIRHERHGLRRGAIRVPLEALDEYRKSRTVPERAPTPAPVQRQNRKILLKHLEVD